MVPDVEGVQGDATSGEIPENVRLDALDSRSKQALYAFWKVLSVNGFGGNGVGIRVSDDYTTYTALNRLCV